MNEIEENDRLLLLAQERLQHGNLSNTLSEAEVMAHLCISEESIKNAEDALLYHEAEKRRKRHAL